MASPPHEIEQRLAALIPRVRARRVARGAARLAAAALATAAAVLMLDAAFALPATARGLLLSVWLTGFGVLAWRWVVVPWLADIALVEVAEELTATLPEMGARLRAAVSPEGGQPDAVRAAVNEDTARRLKAVNLAGALSAKPVAGFAAVAVGAVAAVALVAAFLPGGSERLRRVALPWARPPYQSVYSVRVTSGEPVVQRGGSVTLSAFADPPSAEAFLCLRNHPGAPETRHPMTADGPAFHFTFTGVVAEFEYCVEVSGTRSDWHRVAVLDAVEPAEGTSIELVPPAYATQPKQTVGTFRDLEGLQYSTVELRLKFNRPAAAAHFEWRPDGATAFDILPLALAPDRTSASASFRLRQNGVLKLVLVNEERGKKLRTETAASVRAVPDAPPRFEQLSGLSGRPRAARPTDTLRITFAARDDRAVTRAELEYVLDEFDSRTARVPIPFTSQDAPQRVAGAIDFALADKARATKTILFRLRVTDSRDLDDPKLPPQEAVYPPSGWSELRIDSDAPPLAEQDVLCQRDTLRDALAAARKELVEAAGAINAVRTEAGREPLTLDQNVRLNNARAHLRAATSILTGAAREAALTVELRPLAGAVRAVAEVEPRRAEEMLQRADTDSPDTRTAALAGAGTHIAEATRQLDAADAHNARLAQTRLDCLKLAALAADQSALIEAIATRVARLNRQRELRARLEALVAASEPLRTAVATAKGAEVGRLARRGRALAEALHALDASAEATVVQARAELVAAIAREQQALAKQTAALVAELGTAARLAGVPLPRPGELPRVAELAAAGQTVDALAELEKQSQALERVAVVFERWAAERADPKLAAKQLARWQDDLLARLRAATTDVAFTKLPEAAKSAFRAEQKALAEAIPALPPGPDSAIRKNRDEAAFHSANANKFLLDTGEGATRAMELTAAALSRFADRMPTVAERLTRSLRDSETLRQELEMSSNAVEAVLKGYERSFAHPAAPTELARKFVPQVERQRKLIDGVAALDLPGLGERQARVVRALSAAVEDMQAGAPFDVQASQQWARREFERLRLVAQGQPSPDAKVEEIHRALAALADSLDALGPKLTARHLEPAAPVLLKAGRALTSLLIPEAPALVNDVRAALQAAEASLRDPKPAVARARIRAATEALGQLSDRLNGYETDLERVRRLAALRHHATEKPKDLFGSDEPARQLARELEELTHTRVGFAGQVLKKRVLDLYAKLRAKSDPDRAGTDLKALAMALDELAAKMADVAELATLPPREPAPAATPNADLFLPSKALVDALRGLVRVQRGLHTQVADLAPELNRRLTPGVWSAPGRSVLLQLAALEELARGATEFESRLADAAKSSGPEEASGRALRDAVRAVAEGQKFLADAVQRVATSEFVQAGAARVSAGASLNQIAEALAAVAPPGTSVPAGDALRSAERAMRRAEAALASDDTSDVTKAMTAAARSLAAAADALGK